MAVNLELFKLEGSESADGGGGGGDGVGPYATETGPGRRLGVAKFDKPAVRIIFKSLRFVRSSFLLERGLKAFS
jgi:hypothetical protein